MKILTPHPQRPDFLLHAITKDYFFFIDTEESDEVNAVKMTDKQLNLISDNWLACDYLFGLLQEDSPEILSLSDEMQYNKTELLKQSINI